MFLALSALLGFGLDMIFGDNWGFPHPVLLIGKVVRSTENLMRRLLNEKKFNSGDEALDETVCGILLVIITLSAVCLPVIALRSIARYSGEWAVFIINVLFAGIFLAGKGLKKESMKVYDSLQNLNIFESRQAIARLVSRDTDRLGEPGIIRAAVETISENASDALVAPLFWFFILGGAPGIVFYKTVNTMDSMIGYKNEKYLNFGMFAARLDDIVNFVPARLAGALMCIAAAFTGGYPNGAWTIYLRDRKKHASPNSAHTEAACAGALGIQLGGEVTYFGVTSEKPTIGDALRPIERSDIPAANRLMIATGILMLAVMLFIGWFTFVARISL